jgi:hypothetical protein
MLGSDGEGLSFRIYCGFCHRHSALVAESANGIPACTGMTGKCSGVMGKVCHSALVAESANGIPACAGMTVLRECDGVLFGF